MRPRKQGSLELTSSAFLETITCKYLSRGTWWKQHHLLWSCNKIFSCLINMLLKDSTLKTLFNEGIIYAHFGHSGWKSWGFDEQLLPCMFKSWSPSCSKRRSIQRKELRFPLRTSDVVNLQACFPLLPAPVHGSPNTQGLLWAKRPQPLTARSTHLQSSIPRLPVSPWAAGPGCPQRGQSRAPQSCPVWMGCRTDPVASVHLKPHSFLLFISSTIHGPSVSS